jgi:hypothetical protein
MMSTCLLWTHVIITSLSHCFVTEYVTSRARLFSNVAPFLPFDSDMIPLRYFSPTELVAGYTWVQLAWQKVQNWLFRDFLTTAVLCNFDRRTCMHIFTHIYGPNHTLVNSIGGWLEDVWRNSLGLPAGLWALQFTSYSFSNMDNCCKILILNNFSTVWAGANLQHVS